MRDRLKFYTAAVLALLVVLPAWAQEPDIAQPAARPAKAIAVPNVPVSLASGGTFTSACLPINRLRAYTVFAALHGVGTLVTQRYADPACKDPVGATVPSSALTLTQAAGCPATSTYCGSVSANDGVVALFMTLTLTDTSSATNAIVALVLLQGGGN
jgi:hypothetical protein